MKEQDALFAAILDAPDDDAPRLVYADWLDEHGQPERAEFIRVQIERARLLADNPRAEALKKREKVLWEAHGDGWRKELPVWARPRCLYERGFATAVQARARDFLKGAAGLLRRAPVRRVELRNLDDALAAAVAASPALGRLSAFGVYFSNLTGAGWRALLSAPGLGNVTALDLGGGAFGPAEASALASSPHLRRLTSLVLRGGRLGDLGLQD